MSAVRVLRRTGAGTLAYELDLEGLLASADPLADLDIRAGDTISVPSRGSFITEIAENIRNFAPFLSLATTIILASR